MATLQACNDMMLHAHGLMHNNVCGNTFHLQHRAVALGSTLSHPGDKQGLHVPAKEHTTGSHAVMVQRKEGILTTVKNTLFKQENCVL